uniref:Uncharacterized protein n=1 Tax=Monopterus albus TaxID=43700 RepID=A0A3Q3IPZ9_MONAL
KMLATKRGSTSTEAVIRFLLQENQSGLVLCPRVRTSTFSTTHLSSWTPRPRGICSGRGGSGLLMKYTSRGQH